MNRCTEGSLMKSLRKLAADESGQDLVEYGVTLAIVGLGAGIAAVAMAQSVNVLWSTAASLTALAV
jgi:Flp pilus assembly pilin Flp